LRLADDTKVKGANTYTAKDRKYMIAANTITTSKFGPSGSLMKKNTVREQTRDVIPKINNGIFCDLKFIFAL